MRTDNSSPDQPASAFAHFRGAHLEGVASHLIEHDETRSGSNLVAGWRASGGTLTATADRVGMVPIFYWSDGDAIVLAESLQAVVRRMPRPRLDDAAVATFLRLGFYVGDDTPIHGVKVLPPGARLTWNNGRVRLDSPGLPIPEPFEGTYRTAVDTYCELFSFAVAERAALGVGRLTVSGGRDSRHILLELLRQGFPPPAIVTQDRPVNTDFAIGRLLAERCGIEFIPVAPFRSRLVDEYEKNRLNHFLSDENTWYLQIRDHLAGPIFDGLAGGMLSGTDMFRSDWLIELMRKRPADAAGALLASIGQEPGFLAAEYAERWNRDLAVHAIAVQLERHLQAPNPLTSFLFWNRTRREISLIPITIAARSVPVRLPYLDPSLMTFLSSLPASAYSGTAFHSDVMMRAYPAYRTVPYGEKRKSRRTLRAALEAVQTVHRHRGSPILSRRFRQIETVKTLVDREGARLDWIYRVLPIVQLVDELDVSLSC